MRGTDRLFIIDVGAMAGTGAPTVSLARVRRGER